MFKFSLIFECLSLALKVFRILSNKSAPPQSSSASPDTSTFDEDVGRILNAVYTVVERRDPEYDRSKRFWGR